MALFSARESLYQTKFKMLQEANPIKIHRKQMRRLRSVLPCGFRFGVLIWATFLVGITYILTYVELDEVRFALGKIKLRSSGSRHDHEDTSNSGPHTLQQEELKSESEEHNVTDFPGIDDDILTARPVEEPPVVLDTEIAGQEKQDGTVELQAVELKERKVPPVEFVDTPKEERKEETENGAELPSLANVQSPSKSDPDEIKAKLEGNTTPTTTTTSEAAVLASIGQEGPPQVESKENEAGTEFPMDDPLSTVNQNPDEATTTKENWAASQKMDFGYTQEISNKISVKRPVPDSRHGSCLEKQYSKTDLKATIIVSVYNEAWSVLIRTIHSIIERTPKSLISEVLIIDDHSDKELTYMGEPLEKYIFQTWNNVFLLRNEKREGVIMSRLKAVKTNSYGNVVVFLDSHVEVNVGWLEPLLQEIGQNWKTVAVPVLDNINPKTFAYEKGDMIPKQVDGFKWNLQPFKAGKPKMVDGNPIPTPVAGQGIIAVSKKFLNFFGAPDTTRLEFFGGENLEISFQAWMCGGRVEIIPCSRIGHVARGRLPSLRTAQVDTGIQKNLLIVGRTWMGEFTPFFENSLGSKPEVGDVSARIQLKNSLECKSFDWYLKNVYTQLYNPKGQLIADSELRSLGLDGNLCLDAFSQNGSPAQMFPCHGLAGNQRWLYTTKGELRRNDQCLDYWGNDVRFFPCHGEQGNQFWLYLNDVQKMKHVNSGKCLTVKSKERVDMEPCEDDRKDQHWVMKNFNVTAYVEAGFDN